MIFKQLAVSVLNRVLGKYIKDLDANNLELAVLSGQAVLKNLELREDALNEFDLPVEVTQGYIGEISLTIPWTNLYSEPCYIYVEDVYLIAVPVKDKLYDAEKSRASEVNAKRKRLRQIEENAKKTNSTKDSLDTSTEDTSDSFVEKLIAQVVKNLKVSVKNIHFRYEDKITCPEHPFAFGFTLQNLSAETTNDQWEPIVVDADTTTIYKLASLDNLSVYWNTKVSDNNLFNGRWNWKTFMEEGISTKNSIPRHYEFILYPLSAECHVILDQSSEIERDVPKLLVEVIQQELALTLSQKQFHNLMELLDSFELMMINQKYKKFQPTVDVHGNSRSWWKYAYTAICEEKIRCWSWSRIKEHRTRYRAYKELYKKKLQGFYLESERERSLKHLQILENDLDIPSILIARQQAEIEVPPEKREQKEEEDPSSQGGWWSWLGMGATPVTEPLNINSDESIMSKLTVAALPIEEKEKLYKAINYSESTAPVKYPIEYIKRRITFNLDSCVVTLLDETKRKIAEISTVGFAAALEQRPVGDAFMFRLEVNCFQIHGTPDIEKSERPCLVSTQNPSQYSGCPLLSFSAETTNPLDVKADYSVKVKIEPIEVNYDNITVDEVVDFFDVPNKSKLYEIEAAAANKLKELQSWTRAGLEYAITQHKVTYIAMDIRSPLVIVPEYGNLKSKGNLLIMDLGHLTIVSDLVNRENTVKLASDEELATMFYDKFDVKIKDVQILIADQDTDWRKAQKLDASKDHILPSTGLDLQAFKSISAEYPELPQFKATAVIPKIWFKFSDTKYKEFMKFLDHFPFGKAADTIKGAEDVTEKIDKEWSRTASTLSLEEANSIQVLCRDTFHSKTDNEGETDVWFDSVEYLPRKESSSSKAPDLTQLVGEFLIHQLLVTIDKADSSMDKPYISLEIKNLSAKVTVSTWHIKVTTTLGFIELMDNHFHDAEGSPLCVLSSKPKHEWISISYVKADPKGPEFLTSFNNTEQFIKVVFTSIELTAKKEALASFEIFILDLLESSGSQSSLPVIVNKAAPLETIAEDEPLDVRPVSPVQQSATDISIKTEIEEVSVTLVANNQTVGQIKVSGLNVNINMCGSETKISTMLKDLSVLNATEGTLYPKILCLQDNSVFDCEIILFDNKRRPSDPLALDVAVDLRIGQFKFVYLSGFTAHIQNFVQALVSPETVAYAQNLTQQALKSQAQNIQDSGSKIGLKIGVHAPTVKIPGHSFSRDILVAELGKLDITNTIGKTKDGFLMDFIDVSLNSFSVQCLCEGKKLSADYLVEPIKLDVTVKRTLQEAQSNLPLIEVDAVLPLLQLNVAVPDYKLLMTVINKNLSEGSQELEKSTEVSDSEATKNNETMDVIRQRLGSVFQERTKSVSAHTADNQISIKCNVAVNKVVVFSPVIVNNQNKPYLVLTVERLLSTVTLDTWTINVNAELGTLELLDSINTGNNDQPVSILSSSKVEDLISLDYKMVNPACPDFESTYCSVEQQVDFKFRKLDINCSQKSAICLQEHVLALTASDEEVLSEEKILDGSSTSSSSSKSLTPKPASFKIGATLWEVNVLLSMDDKLLTNVGIKGLAADILMWDGGIVIKSTQRDLSVTDLYSDTYYPKIISVENENVFDFEFKSLNQGEVYPVGEDNHTSLDPDSSLVLNIGRINVVFVYRFIDNLMRYVEPLTSPQSTKYVQVTAQKTVYSQIESIQSQGSRISLSVAINAPLVVIPSNSSSVDMLIADLGRLELQNKFQVFELDLTKEKVVFDMMELNLQSVQLARGKMDLSNSSVVKRHLIEPIKMDAKIRRSLKPSCHEFPFVDAHCTLDFIKMNLGSKDYELLTTIMQDNLNEGETRKSQEDIADNISIDSASSHDAYEYMEFTFDLPGASLILYKNEMDLDPFDSQSPVYEPNTKLCLCELEETTVHIAIPTDNSVHIRGVLHGLVVEDARPDTSSAFPRLVDKKMQAYSEVLMSSCEEMCEFIYRQQASGDMDILFQLQHATIFVNFPFIWPLLEFFTTPTPIDKKKDVFVTPAESQTSLDGFSDVRDTNEPHSGEPAVATPSETVLPQYKITVRGTIKNPDVVLLANPLSKDSEALLLQTELEFQYVMNKEEQDLFSNIHDLQMVSCQYPNVKETSFLVLEPCDMTFKYKTPLQDHKGQGIDVDVDTMRLRFSPFLYKILNDVVLTLTGQEKVTEGVQTEGNDIVNPPDDLWEPKPITADSWNKSSDERTVNKTVIRQSTRDKIILNTKEVQIVVVNEVHGAQVPFVMINTKVKANATDYTAQMKLEADVSVEISYYNEHLGAWEPLVEPIEEDRDNPQWELQIKVFFADGYISSFTPRDQESIDGPPQDLTDGPDAHRWIPWQSRPRSESKKKLTSKRSSTGEKKMKSFKKSNRHARREGVQRTEDEEDLDYDGALQQFVVSSTRLIGDATEDTVDSSTCASDDGFLQNEQKPQATYIVINSHDNIQLTITPTALDVLSHISEAFASTTEPAVRSIPGPMFSIYNELGVHSTVIVEHEEKILDKHDDVLTIQHRKPKLERNKSLSDAFANLAASLLLEQRKKKKKKKLFSEPLLGRFREKFLKIQRRRAMSLPLGLEGKTFKSKKKTTFQIGEDSVPNKPKLRKTVSCGVQQIAGAEMEKQSSLSVTQSLGETTLDDEDNDQSHAWRTRLRNRKDELFALMKHDEEDETDFVDNDQDDTSAKDAQEDGDSLSRSGVNCVESKLAMAIGNIGTFCGGISSPTFSDDELEQPEDTCDDSVDGSKAEEEETYISFQVDGYYIVDYVPILRSGRYLYKLKPCIGDESNLNTYVVVQIDTKNGQKTVTLRSPLQVHSHLNLSVDILTYDESKIGAKNPFIHLLTVEPDSVSNIPMTMAYEKDIYLKLHHPRCGVSQDPLSWRNFSKEDIIFKFPQISRVETEPLESLDGDKPLQVKAHFQVDSLTKTPSKDVPHHVIHLHPPMTLHNLLPVEISRLTMGESQREELILPGEKVTVMTESVENSCQLSIKLNNYKDQDWFGMLSVDKNTGKTTELHMRNSADPNNDLVLGVLLMHSGTTDITIYCPYWLINKTHLPMEYRISKTHQMFYQTAVGDQPLLFSFPRKSNRKVRMRVTDASWSSHISLDAVGDSGLVSCYNSRKARKFEFVLQIIMSQTGLTKIVTLTPKYVLINKAEFSLSFCEDGIAAPLWYAIEPSEVKPFWPISSTKQLYIKPTLSSFVSKAFPYNYSHTSVLRMVEPKAICVEVHGDIEGSVTTILFTPYSPGVGTIRIENLCDIISLRFLQAKTCHVTVLQPQFSLLYTWDDPTKQRQLYWKPYLGVDDAIEVPIYKDSYGKVQLEISEEGPDIKEDRKRLEDSGVSCSVGCSPSCIPSSRLPSDTEESGSDEIDGVATRLRRRSSKRYKKTIYWVSLLDGLQRVLLFTEDGQLASKARKSSECEPVSFEVFVSLDGVGLSLLNNRPEEVANITLSSSTSVWQVEKSPGHWKTLGIELSTWLEDAWKNGQEQLNMDDTATVDFSRMEMIKPYEGSLRRSFEPALWFHYCSSQHYQSVHSKMHRIQIDNQLYGTVFPVALYPAPLPMGVALRDGPKPFIEMSIIYHEVPGQGVNHFKYAKVLIQEMNVKLDKSFILALTSLFSKPPESYDEEVLFKMDTESYQVQLNETMAVKAALQAKRVFLEYFHLSPLKINLSFSLESDVDDDPDQAFAADIMDFFVDSIGATLTDMNDAQLKLAFFERVGVFITQENLKSQITTHYTMQGVRQIYALVLGLDVLGNPYALISGIGEGVKDLFYEPYQGIIYGPQEFAEGLARGVKSLLGHVVGGTAGAFSRITGSIGQAVATLSFDTDYRLKRRQRMHIEPSGIGQGLMMGGKSLVMGLVFGIGGIVMKPIEGARTEGVEGFFKGIGKGLLGLLTRPTGGVIDMVSFTLDGIRRSAEQGGEDIAHRMRLPRFAAPNEPLKPYSKQEAMGFGILKSLPRALELSRDVYGSDFSVSGDGRLVLLTNKRIIMLNQSRFWREWKVEWMCPYEEVTSTPFIAANSLVIKYQKSNDDDIITNVYEIQCDDPDRLKDLRAKIIGLLRRFK